MAELDEATQAARISDDQINREIFEENVELVLQAWTQDSVEAKGRWQVPYPYEEGVDWTMTATREMGRRARWTSTTRSAGSASRPAR